MKTSERGLKVLMIMGLTASVLTVLYLSQGLVLFAAMLLGSGGNGTAKAVVDFFEPAGHFAIALVLGSSIAAAISAMTCPPKNIDTCIVVGAILGGGIASSAPQLKNSLVSITIYLMQRL